MVRLGGIKVRRTAKMRIMFHGVCFEEGNRAGLGAMDEVLEGAPFVVKSWNKDLIRIQLMDKRYFFAEAVTTAED